MIRSGLFLLFTVMAFAMSAQRNEFVLEGRLKVDGGSVNGSKIVLEKDGRQVKTIEGESKFDIGLDYQAIYVISFIKEGFVTKRLRFDTHVPEDRIEYGFEPFGFQVELFEQYDDVSMVVFNQPVGKISYSELIDEFDYDTDYTKSIQSQLDQAQKDVEVAKQKKEEQKEQVGKEVQNLVSQAESSAKSGNYEEAINNLEEAKKLKKDPTLDAKIDQFKKEQVKQAKQEEFNKVMEEAGAAMASGDLEEAKKLYSEANGLMEGDSKVKSQLQKVEQELQKQNQQQAAFDQATKSANSALKAGDYDKAIADAEAALGIKPDPAMDQVIKDATAAKEEAEAKAAAAAEEEAQYNKLVAEADKAFEKGDYEAAAAKYNEAKQIKATPELDEKARNVQNAIAQLEEEKRKEKEAQEKLASTITKINDAIAEGDIASAKSLLEEAKALGEDDRLSALAKAIEEEEKRIAEAAEAKLEQTEKINTTLASASEALTSGDLDEAESKYNEAKSLGADEKKVSDGLAKVAAKRAELAEKEAAEAAKQAEQKAKVDALIVEAQKAMDGGDFVTAKSKLAEASALGKDDRIPSMLDAIKEMEAAAAKAQEKEQEQLAEYQKLIDEGNEALTSDDLDKAVKAFNKAKSLNETDPQAEEGLKTVESRRGELVAEAEAAAAQEEERKRQESYNALMQSANEALGADELTKAEKDFTEAKKYTDDASEADAGLAAIAEKRKSMNAAEAAAEAAAAKKAAEEEQAKLDKAFGEKIAAADEAFQADDLQEAKGLYNEAIDIKQDDYASSQLAAIEAKENEIAAEQDAEVAAKLAAEQEKQKKLAAEKAATAEAERIEKERLAALEAERLAAEKAAKQKEEEPELPKEEAKEKDDAEAEALAVQKAEEERLKAEAEAQKRSDAAALAKKQEAFNQKKSEAEALLKANKLDQAITAYKEALNLYPEDSDVKKKIADVQALKAKLLADKAKNEEAALAITEQRGRESEQLAEIIEEEESKATVNEISEEKETEVNVKSVRMAQPIAEQEAAPGSNPMSPVIISEQKMGKEARETKTANLTEDEVYDGIMERVDDQREEMIRDEEQMRLMNKYKNRKTVETDTVGNSVVTMVYINNGKFVTTYKKVEHNWGGVYYFVEGRSTNQRFWDHETQ